RHFAPHRCFLLRHIDDAAAAFADFLQKLVTPDAIPDSFQGGRRARWSLRRLVRQEAAGLRVRLQQFFHLASQGGIAATRAIKVRGAVAGIVDLQRGEKNRSQRMVLFAHGRRLFMRERRGHRANPSLNGLQAVSIPGKATPAQRSSSAWPSARKSPWRAPPLRSSIRRKSAASPVPPPAPHAPPASATHRRSAAVFRLRPSPPHPPCPDRSPRGGRRV